VPLLMRMVLMKRMLIRMVKAATKLGQTDGRMVHRATTAALRTHMQRRPQLQLLMMMVMMLLLLLMMLVLLMLRYLLMWLLLMQLQLLLLTLQLRRDLALLASKRLYCIRLLLCIRGKIIL